jgi:hypothetical protein
MIFSVSVPGFGQVFVEAAESGAATSAVQQFLNRNRIQLADGERIGVAIPAIAAQVGNRLLIKASETTATQPAQESVTEHPESQRNDAVSSLQTAGEHEAETATLSSQPGEAVFVGKVIGANGVPAFYRVTSSDTSAARSILEAQFGSSGFVEIVSLPDFFFENDTDFVRAVQDGQFPGIDDFVLSLPEVIAQEPSNTVDDLDSPSPLPVDVQDFPFASFQNAVAELGLDPEGVLGGTVSRQFDTLAPVAQIGSLTGTIDPIGQSPGALEAFFRDEFGDLELAAQTFRDLLAGQTAGDLDADQLLAFSALADPDVSTSRGRGAAGDVFRLARAAAENQFGSFVASRLLPTNQRLFRELERRLADGDLSTDFLEFARSQNLLPV